MKPKVRLRYRFSEGLEVYVWFADVFCALGHIRTSYYGTCSAALKAALEYL